MKEVKEELESRSWIWFKAFEKRFLVNLLKAQGILITWRRSLRSVEFWNFSWLWTALLMKICSLKIRFAVGEGTQKRLLSWVSSHVPKKYLVKGFPECFNDGIVLCALVEKLANGSCPRYDLLDPDQPGRNMKLAFHLVEKHIKIRPVITAKEILQGSKFSERKLLLLIAQMKLMSEMCNLPANSPNLHKNYMSQTTFVSEKCFARGMGLLLAVRGRKACFTIVLDSIDNLDMVIEIRGPKNTACSKRITSISSLSKIDSSDIRDIMDAQIQEDILRKKIPLEYTIVGQKITVSYTPLESGTHHMSIIWQGQHILGSPYTITVDSSVEAPDIWPVPSKRGYSRLQRSDSQYYDESIQGKKEKSLASCSESAGIITRKRILRYIVRIDGNDVVIDGKEDLCEAINCIKKKQENPSADREFSLNSQDQLISDFPLSASENIKSETENLLYVRCDTSTEQHINVDSPDTAKKMEMDVEIDNQNPGGQLQKTDCINVSGCLNDRTAMGNNDVHINENENNEMNKKDERTDFNFDLKSNNSLENNGSYDNKRKQIPDKIYAVHVNNHTAENLKENKPKLKVTFLDENFVESDLVLRPSSFSSNFLNPAVKDVSPQTEDINLFPVHKVEYESLHDDDEDTDDPNNYTQKRRRSFTELNESNYLDDDMNDIEHNGNDLKDNFSSEAEKVYPTDIELKYQKELKDYEAVDITNSLQTKHSLFQCDHSLSFFTETLVETPPELAGLENDERKDTSENIFSTRDNELIDLSNEPSKLFKEKSLELEECKSSKRIKLEYTARSSSLTDFYEYTESEDSDPFSFHYTDLSKLECDEFDLSNKSNTIDSVDKRKRTSWCDRDLLPCIRESSIEGLLEPDTDNNETRTAEVNDNISSFNETTIKSEPDPQLITIFSTSCNNDAKSDEISGTNDEFQSVSEKFVKKIETATAMETDMVTHNMLGNKTDVLQKHTLSEDPNKIKFSSMNILSASPYKNINQSIKHSEVKFSTVTNSVKSSQINPPEGYLKSQDKSGAYLLAHATPAVVEECQSSTKESQKVEEEECKENVSDKIMPPNDLHELKSAQCLSVKKVIQIFQKEKEEPVDTWPTETKNYKTPNCLKTLKNDSLTVEKDDKNDLLLKEISLNTPIVEKSYSSIKDRVKLFESESPRMIKPNNTEKRTRSSISAKKNYWENMTT